MFHLKWYSFRYALHIPIRHPFFVSTRKYDFRLKTPIITHTANENEHLFKYTNKICRATGGKSWVCPHFLLIEMKKKNFLAFNMISVCRFAWNFLHAILFDYWICTSIFEFSTYLFYFFNQLYYTQRLGNIMYGLLDGKHTTRQRYISRHQLHRLNVLTVTSSELANRMLWHGNEKFEMGCQQNKTSDR